MNRTQYEKIHGKKVVTPCRVCQRTREMSLKLRKRRRAEREAQRKALAFGVASGLVTILYEQDEFTGLHYRSAGMEHITLEGE